MRGDKGMIKELIENLTHNAIQYNNPNCKVTIRIELLEKRPVLRSIDNGIGIPEKDQERVFKRFYQIDKSRSKATTGTGLTLAIVKHVVEIHDGDIFLDSKFSKGTTVTVIF